MNYLYTTCLYIKKDLTLNNPQGFDVPLDNNQYLKTQDKKFKSHNLGIS